MIQAKRLAIECPDGFFEKRWNGKLKQPVEAVVRNIIQKVKQMLKTFGKIGLMKISVKICVFLGLLGHLERMAQLDQKPLWPRVANWLCRSKLATSEWGSTTVDASEIPQWSQAGMYLKTYLKFWIN